MYFKADAWNEGDYQTYLASLKSPIRTHVINTILPQVLESYFDGENLSPKFRRLGLWTKDSKGTSCGLLPTYVANQLGTSKGLQYNVQGLRGLAMSIPSDAGSLAKLNETGVNAEGVWIDPEQYEYDDIYEGKVRPLPGDLYGLSKPGDTKFHPQHVGVIVDARGDNWITADAGQGARPVQLALYCKRRYDSELGTLSGPIMSANGRSTPTEVGTVRRVAGWIDIELFTLKSGSPLFAS